MYKIISLYYFIRNLGKCPIADHQQQFLSCCRARTVPFCVAFLLLSGLLVQMFWPSTVLNNSRKTDFVQARSRPNFGNVSCSGPLHLIECLENASKWNYEPPTLLDAACRQFAVGETKTRQVLLVFVPVTANMSRQRAAVRRTWGRSRAGFELLTFVVQLLDGEPIDPMLSNEAAAFDDIFLMRGPAEDSYPCLTLKILSFLRWYSDSCRGTFQYLLKSDHDSYWNMKSLIRLLRHRLMIDNGTGTANQSSTAWSRTASPPVAEILGSIQRRARVLRNKDSKFCTPSEAYSPNEYPTYVVGGPGYLLSDAAVVSLTEASTRLTPFWLEDVYITGMLAASAKPPVRHGHVSDVHYGPVDAGLVRAKAIQRPPLGIHGLSVGQLDQLHTWLGEPLAAERAEKFHAIGKLEA